MTDSIRHRVVIIGSGFGGLFSAKYLRRADVDVTVISRTSHHLFQPLLYQVATGILSQGEIAPATRELVKRHKRTQVFLGEVTHIDVAAKQVRSRAGEVVTLHDYDTLIVAAGAETGYFGNDQFALPAPGLKSIDDALELRARIFGAFEMAEVEPDPVEQQKWLTFVVVGAGPTGVEMAGQIIELSRRTLKKDYRNIDPTKARVVLVEGGEDVLASFGPDLARRAQTKLEKLGIEVRLQSLVNDVDEHGVDITFRDGTNERIDSRCVVWAAGVQASPLSKTLAAQTGTELDRSGRMKCNPDLTLPGHPEIFVLGDMIALNNYPGVAQVAMQGAKYSAKKIRRRLDDKDHDEPFTYFDKGSMATISRFRAVAKIGRIELTGFLAWVMWLFIHILYLVGFQEKVSTLGHWAVAFIGRGRAERTFTLEQARGSLDASAAVRQDLRPVDVPAIEPEDADGHGHEHEDQRQTGTQ